MISSLLHTTTTVIPFTPFNVSVPIQGATDFFLASPTHKEATVFTPSSPKFVNHPLTSTSSAYTTHIAPSGLHLTIPEEVDLIAMLPEFLANQTSLPNQRLVLQTEHWQNPIKQTDELLTALQSLSDGYNITITLKTGAEPYALEFVSKKILQGQEALGPMLAIGNNPPRDINISRLVNEVKSIFENPAEFTRAYEEFSQLTSAFEAPKHFIGSTIKESAEYRRWEALIPKICGLLDLLSKLSRSLGLSRQNKNEKSKVDFLTYYLSVSFDKITPKEYVLAYSDALPADLKGRLQDNYRARTRGIRQSFEPHFIPNINELNLLTSNILHYRLAPDESPKRIALYFEASVHFFAAAYLCFRNLMDDLLNSLTAVYLHKDDLLQRFQIVSNYLEGGKSARQKEANRPEHFETTYAFVKGYWESIFYGALLVLGFDDGPTQNAAIVPRAPNGPLPTLPAPAMELELTTAGTHRTRPTF